MKHWIFCGLIAALIFALIAYVTYGIVSILALTAKTRKIKHWCTTAIGLASIVLGLWSFHLHWISYQTVYFNLVYGEVPQLGLIVAGTIGLFAADGRHVK